MKVKVRCIAVLPEHCVIDAGEQYLTVGKIYEGWDLESNCPTYGQSVYVIDDSGDESAMFGDEFEVVKEDE